MLQLRFGYTYALQVTKYQAEALEMALEFETSDFTEDTKRQFKEVLVSIWYMSFSVLQTFCNQNANNWQHWSLSNKSYGCPINYIKLFRMELKGCQRRKRRN